MILCCGEALIDFLPRKGADGAEVYQPFNGGSIFNTAIALGRLGVKVSYFGGLSTDFFGDSLVEGFKQSHVDLKLAKIHDLGTTLAFVKLSNGQARYSFLDSLSAGRMLTKKDLPKLSKSCTALHFGSISLIPEPCGSTYEGLMRREAKSRVICLDPNIRPTLISKKRDHIARLNRLIGLCDILKISDEDVHWMTGHHDLAKAGLAEERPKDCGDHQRRRRCRDLHQSVFVRPSSSQSRSGRYSGCWRYVHCGAFGNTVERGPPHQEKSGWYK
jgi:fructokinase